MTGLGILVLLAYLPSFPGDFHFDDFALMLENPLVTAPHFSYGLFLEEYGGRPLTLWTFHWNYRLFGASAWSYHAFSLLLHLTAVMLLLVLIRQASNMKQATIAAALFALHPVQTQAVNYIWSRSILLMFCFGLMSLLVVRRRPWLSLVFLQLAVWSRFDGLIFLVPLILLNRRFWKLPSALAVLNSGAFIYSMSRYQPEEFGWTHPDVFGYWLSQPVAFWKYMRLMMWPAGLTIDHDFAIRHVWEPVAAITGLLIVGCMLWRTSGRYRFEFLAACWLVLALAPAALLPNSDSFNESRIYPALAGFAIIAASLLKRAPKPVTAAVVVLLLSMMIPATAFRNRLWNDDLLLWQDAAIKSPGKARVHYNLGVAWARRGDIALAESSFERAVKLDPSDDFSHAALGYCAEVRQDWPAAMARYRHAFLLNARNRYADEGCRRVMRQLQTPPKDQRL